MMRALFISLLLVPIGFSLARTVDEAAVRQAAEALLKESLLSQHFPAHTIQSVEPLGALWHISLHPSGYLLLSGSTRLTPLIAFSTTDFRRYPDGHPATTILMRTQNRAETLETAPSTLELFSPTPETSAIQAAENRWGQLLNPPSATLFSEATTTTVGPFLNTIWGQGAPYNDFCPQFNAETSQDGTSYAGRTPVGCVATMYTQILQYYAWPYRLEEPFSVTLNAESCAITNNYQMYFDNALPFNWATLKQRYNTTGESEADRLAVARACLFSAMISNMKFDPSGSAASAATPTKNNYYTAGNGVSKVAADPFTSEQREQIKATLDAGCPIPTTIPGHAIVTDGYRQTSAGEFYLSLNYGWSGSYNDFWSIGDSYDHINITWMLLNHHPKQMLQMEPLPTKTLDSVTLKWHIPTFWEKAISGFMLTTAIPNETSTSTWQESFTAIADPDANTEIYTLASKSENNISFPVLNVRSTTSTTGEMYLCPDSFIPANTSVMTLKTRAKYTIRHALELQINANGSGWNTLCVVPGEDEDEQTEWHTFSIPLTEYAGKNCQIRLKTWRTGSGWVYGLDSEFSLRDWSVSDVQGKPTVINTSQLEPSIREKVITNLTPGTHYSFTMTPLFNGTPGKSATVSTQYGTRLTLPEIKSISDTKKNPLIDNTLRQGTSNGKTVLRVTCNETTTRLRVTSGNLTLLPASAIRVFPYNKTTFDIVLSTNFTNIDVDGSRILLTLTAEDDHGNTTHQNCVVSLRTFLADESYTPPFLDYVTNAGTTITIPYYWFHDNGLVAESSAVNAYAAAAQTDGDKDGFQAWEEWLCNTSPTNALSKLQITAFDFTEDGTLHTIQIEPKSTPNARLLLQGKTSLTDTVWNSADLTVHRFFRIKATPKPKE
ncbi:MAG: C10 family peptidase [Kiritimatiellae bacterium]|nr:C10 family peptidase [Kiritimatiellia bacterium]